jgi:DNA-binding NarL/FixJ family response regulator
VNRSGAIRIFIADDHPIVRQGLRRIVEADPGLAISGEAGDAAAMLAALDKTPTDLLLLDVAMPGSQFLDTLREVRERQPSVRVLVLSIHPEDQWATRALRAGASGYLTKDHSPEQLLEAIRRVYRGGKYVSPSLAQQLASQLDRSAECALHEQLSDREFEVLVRLGNGHTVGEIAEELELSAKMKLATNADLVRYASRHGLIS